MIIQLRSPYQTARGRDSVVGGNVLYPLGIRMISRSFAQPDNPQAAAQVSVRTYFTLASQAFGAITDAERTAWQSLADALPSTDMDGLAYSRTAKGMYVSVNSIRQIDGQAITDTAPAAVTQAAPLSITSATIAGGNLTVIFTHANADGFFMFEGSEALAVAQRHARDRDYRLITAVLADAIIARGASPQSAVFSVAGLKFPWITTDRVGLRITAISAGYVRGQSYTEEVTIA